MEPPFDPALALAGPPEPWASTGMPSIRPGPPWHMTEMIAAEPYLARRLLTRLADPAGPAARLAAAIVEAAGAGRPIVFVGCGTSEHAALGLAEILREALGDRGLPSGTGAAGAPVAAQAFEAALEPGFGAGGLVVGVSHEGATAATNRALELARERGARVGLVTVTRRSPGAALAEAGLVIETLELDQGWCHTVGYLSPILVATALAGHLAGRPVDPEAAAALVAAGAADTISAERIAAGLADARTLLVIGSGADRPAARELVLKVEEASWLPSAMRDLETSLHGHLPATDGETGLVLIATDRRQRAARLDRSRDALEAAAVLGIRVAAILSQGAAEALDERLTPLGRIVVPETPGLAPAVAALLGTATPLQLLTERLARARGTNPDPIRRDDDRYRAASDAAG